MQPSPQNPKESMGHSEKKADSELLGPSPFTASFILLIFFEDRLYASTAHGPRNT